MASARVAWSERNRPAHRRGHGHRARLLHTPHGHAEVLGLDDDQHAPGREHPVDGVGDLGGHALLYLQPAGVPVDQAGQLGESRDAPVLRRNVGHVRPAQERDQVVLAQRGERDVAHHDHLVVLGGEGDFEVAGRVVRQPGEQLLVHAGDPPGRVDQPVAVDVLAYGDQDLRDGRLALAQRLPPRILLDHLVLRLPRRRTRRRGGPLGDYGNAPPHRARSPRRTRPGCGIRRTGGRAGPAAHRP